MDTIFDKIIKGELPCDKVYEDDNFLVILDKFPANAGHCLILPKIPAKDIYDLDESMAAALYPLAKRVAAGLKAVLNCDGINILQNNESAAGQVIFYFHLHIIPRFKEDSITIKTVYKKDAELPKEDYKNLVAAIALDGNGVVL